MSFGDDALAFAEKARTNIDGTVRRTVTEVGALLIARSPVRTGMFRANWQLGLDGVPEGYLTVVRPPDNPAPPPGVPTLEPGVGIAGHRFCWTNNTPYAGKLERGEGGRPPLGLGGLAEMEFVSVVEAAAALARD